MFTTQTPTFMNPVSTVVLLVAMMRTREVLMVHISRVTTKKKTNIQTNMIPKNSNEVEDINTNELSRKTNVSIGDHTLERFIIRAKS